MCSQSWSSAGRPDGGLLYGNACLLTARVVGVGVTWTTVLEVTITIAEIVSPAIALRVEEETVGATGLDNAHTGGEAHTWGDD